MAVPTGRPPDLLSFGKVLGNHTLIESYYHFNAEECKFRNVECPTLVNFLGVFSDLFPFLNKPGNHVQMESEDSLQLHGVLKLKKFCKSLRLIIFWQSNYIYIYK